MRHYLGSVQNYFRTIEHTVRSFFHSLRTTSLHTISPLALILIPSGLVSWGVYVFAMPSSESVDHETQREATPSQQSVQSQQDVSSQSSADISNSATTNHSQTQVSVNGQDIAVSANGQVHKDIAMENGTTTVDITSDSSSSGSSQTTSIMQLEVNSHTETHGGP